ncbi:MAG TPA: HPF/RaiA family ribosome-associated protein [Polyangiaceae bacterium]
MQMPLQVTFHGVSSTNALANYIEKKARKLDELYGRIVNCRVAFEVPHRHSREGRRYRVRIDLRFPGEEIAISRDLGDSELDAYATIDAAFDEAKRRLADHAAIRRGDVKRHELPRHGWISKLFSYEGYGFIESDDGQEIYFHKNAVLKNAFDRLRRGARVKFLEEEGDDGVHATSISLLRGGHVLA